MNNRQKLLQAHRDYVESNNPFKALIMRSIPYDMKIQKKYFFKWYGKYNEGKYLN